MPEQIEALITRFAPGSRLVSAQPLTGGISAGMTAITLEHPDGRREDLVVRVQGRRSFDFDPDATRRMYRTLQTLAPVLPSIPAPLYLDPGGELFGTPCLVMRRLSGSPNCSRDFGPVYARKAADLLAAIHRLGGAAGDLSFLPPFEHWVELELNHKPDLPDVPLQETRIRAALGTVFPPEPANRPVPLHGDYWPGNLLWEGDRLSGVVDWEASAFGDPLADLAIARLDILFAFGGEAMQTFTTRFLAASPAVDARSLPAWDLYAALRPANELHEWAAGWLDLGRPDVTIETMRANHAWFVAEAFRRL